jgi:D-alanine-D-alanine ligase
MNSENKACVAVVFGGRSGEHEVSLVSAQSVLEALNRDKYEIILIGISKSGAWFTGPDVLNYLRNGIDGDVHRCALSLDPDDRALLLIDGDAVCGRRRIDVVIPALHGTFGEDGTLQGLFEIAGIPYAGSGVLGSALAMDKVFQKTIHGNAGLPVVDFLAFSSKQHAAHQSEAGRRVEQSLGYPVFVKPANLGSSVGITKVNRDDELAAAIALAFSFDTKIIIEKAVPHAREIEVAVLGNEDAFASHPGEIIPCNDFYDYDAKYIDGASSSLIPAALPEMMAERIRALALEAFHTLDCAGMARVDFLLDDETQDIFLNEVNTIPGFTSISMYAKLLAADGISYTALLDKLIDLAFERHRNTSALHRSYAPKRDWHIRT